MKVKELIKKLNKHNLDKDVVVYSIIQLWLFRGAWSLRLGACGLVLLFFHLFDRPIALIF